MDGNIGVGGWNLAFSRWDTVKLDNLPPVFHTIVLA